MPPGLKLVLLACAIALASVSGCRSRATPPSPPSTATAPLTTTSSAPIPSPSAARTSDEPQTFAELRALFPERPPWPRGKGVACGDGRCRVGELCCESGERRVCMSGGRRASCAWATAVECDDSSDCAGEQLCCHGLLNPRESLVACASPKRCAVPWDRPGGSGIPAREICARGGACRSKGKVCIASETEVSGGECVSEVARVGCGAAGACPPDRPWCFWNADTKTGECIPRGPWLRRRGVLACDDPGDCPGELCCGGDRYTFCSVECWPGVGNAAVVCRDVSNCEDYEGRTRTCDPDESLPNGLGTCGWAPPP